MSSTFGFGNFIKKIARKKIDIDNAIDETLQESAMEGVAEIQSRTGVVTGNLRRSATSGEIKVVGKVHSIKIGYDINQAPHADAYENGHKQEPGQYVPAIGKKLKQSYVPGKHVVADSLTIVRAGLNAKLKKKLGDIK